MQAKDVARSAKSLISLLQSQLGQQVQIELRNDTYIMGTLEGVDCFMNTEVSNAHLWSIYAEISEQLSGNSDEPIVIKTEPDPEFLLAQPRVDYMFIKGSRIRYFHLPEEIDIIGSIEQRLASYSRRRAPMERPFNWKSYRKNEKLLKAQQKLDAIQQAQQKTQKHEEATNPS